MNVRKMCLSLTLVKGGQKKEDQSQQFPTIRCSEWSILKICILATNMSDTGGLIVYEIIVGKLPLC